MSDPVFEMDENEEDPTLALEEAQNAPPADEGATPDAGGAPPEAADDAAAEHSDVSRNLTLAVKQERERRKAGDAALAAEREQRIRLEERINAYTQQRNAEIARQQQEQLAAQRAAQGQVDPAPDPTEDPEAYREWQLREIQRRQEAMQQQFVAQQEYAAQVEQQRAVQARWKHLEDEVNRSETRVSIQRPDYKQAFEHVVAARFAHWRAANPNLPDDRIWQKLGAERMELLDGCAAGIRPDGTIQWNVEPAEAIYNLAMQYGYRAGGAQQAAAVPQQNGAGAPNGAAPPQARANPRVQNLQAGVAAAARQNAGGRPADPGGRITIEKLNAMSDAEFDAFQQQYPGLVEELMS